MSDINASLRVVNMEYEMYNDGLYFLEQAEKEKNFGDKQRCYRFAIVSFASSFEAFINARLKAKLTIDLTIVKDGKTILDFLINGFSLNNKTVPNELKTIKRKIELLEKLYGVSGQLINSVNFNKFNDEIILLRNSIVHYSHGNFTNVYQQQIDNAALNVSQLFIDTISSFVQVLQIDYPSYFSNKNYIPIE